MNVDLLDWFTAKYPQGYMFEEYVPLAKLEEKLYEMFCKHTGSLFSKKFLHILLQSTRRVNCDPSIRYFMDTEDWYE